MQKKLLGLLLFITTVAVGSFPQDIESIVKSSQVPPELRGSLASRLNLFVKAQAEGRWDEVSTLLGDVRTAFIRDVPFTAAHRECLISKMEASPMIGFDLKEVKDPPSWFISTPSRPVRPTRRSWVLVGEGSFGGESATIKREAYVVAYRDRDEWYFSPNPVDNVGYTQDELLKERKDEVQLLVPANCPLEVVDLHVLIEPNNVKSRQVQFRLRNRTNKRINRYGFRMDDERKTGAIEFAGGDQLEPGAITKEFNETYALYSFWRCEGEPSIRIQIDHVGFEDGTEWRPPESPEGKAK